VDGEEQNLERRRSYELRFDRLENKIDAIVAAINGLVRIEERQAAHTERLSKLEAEVADLRREFSEFKIGHATTNHTVKNAERFVWILVSGCVAAVATVLGGFS
jgi:hypothetical protein